MAEAKESTIGSVLADRRSSRLGLFLGSMLIGVLSGFTVVLFRLALERAEEFRSTLFDQLRTGAAAAFALWIPVFALVALILGWMSFKRPMIKGSGIPQIKGVLLHKMRLEWIPELPMKIIGGVLGLGFGLSLGREGPSVQIGSYVAEGALSVGRRPASERKYLITAGAAAGLSAAFNAPLAGVLFVLEELHRNFSPLLLACAMGASVAGDLVAGYFFGLKPVFDFHAIVPLQANRFLWILLLGALCAPAGDLFKRSLYLAQDAYEKLRVPPVARPLVALAASIPFGLFLFDVTGGGHHLIVELSRSRFDFGLLLVLLAGKVALTAVSYGSGAAGGIFLPLLACGALVGELFGKVLAALSLATEAEAFNFMIIGMAAFFTAVARAPVTGAILILEMSGNFNHFAGLTAGCMAAFVVGDLIRSKGVYDALLERMLKRASCEEPPAEGGKVVIEVPICTGSSLADKPLREVPWPKGSLVVGVRRGESELIPNGSTELRQGDIVLVLVRGECVAQTKEFLIELGNEAP